MEQEFIIQITPEEWAKTPVGIQNRIIDLLKEMYSIEIEQLLQVTKYEEDFGFDYFYGKGIH